MNFLKSKRESNGREKDRCRLGENIFCLLYFCQLLQGLWWEQSTSRLFLPQEIQSMKSFSQRNVISWGHTRRQNYIELNNKNISLQSTLRRYLRLRLLTQSDQSSHNISPEDRKTKKQHKHTEFFQGGKPFYIMVWEYSMLQVYAMDDENTFRCCYTPP